MKGQSLGSNETFLNNKSFTESAGTFFLNIFSGTQYLISFQNLFSALKSVFV